ncbi:hypothetical protein [Mangrovibacterium sp.]|uniref:hypothetical protein n=1 Tax=Mangrovibacterium sp. TaxID=1961364 RepID=UPI0035685E38
MKKNILILAIALIVVATSQSYAQFSLNGEFRPRSEVSHGYKSLAAPDQDASWFTSQRSRLNAFYTADKLVTMLSLQDVRVWGSQAQLVGNEDYAISVHQAWAEVLLSSEFSIKAGRQEVAYDNHRIFGNVGWAQQARSHDMIIFKYQDAINLHFGLAHNENSNPDDNLYDGNDAYKNLQFLWFNKKWDKASLSLLALNNGVPVTVDDSQEVKYSQTLGGYGTFAIGSVNFATNAYLQTGKSTSDIDISAYNLLLEASVKQGFTLGFERLSGTSHDDTKNKSFTPLYGTNHKFNGFMDYFYVGSHINNVGLDDFYLKYSFKKDKWNWDAHLHYFAAAADISDEDSKGLGTEIDLQASYKISPEVNFSFGYSMLFGTDSMEQLKGGDKSTTNYWGYAMLTVTPNFIK